VPERLPLQFTCADLIAACGRQTNVAKARVGNEDPSVLAAGFFVFLRASCLEIEFISSIKPSTAAS